MTTSKVKKMLLTGAAIGLSRSRCRPNRGLHSHLSMCLCVCLSLSAMRRNGNKKTNNNNKRSKNNKGSPTMSRLWQLSLLWRTHLFIKRICSFCGCRKDKKKVNYFVTLIFCLFLLLFSFFVVGICFCLPCIQNKWNIFAVLLSGLCKCLLAKCLRRGSTCIIYVRVYSMYIVYKYICFLYTFISN